MYGCATMSLLEKKALLLTLLIRKKKRKQQRRERLWVHPITSARLTEGAHYLLFKELEKDPTKFFNYFRMSRPTFYELLTYLEDSLQKQNTNMRACIPPQEMVAMTLR